MCNIIGEAASVAFERLAMCQCELPLAACRLGLTPYISLDLKTLKPCSHDQIERNQIVSSVEFGSVMCD